MKHNVRPDDAACVVTAEDIAAYERDGVVCLRGAFSSTWIELLRDAVEEALAHPGPHAEIYTREGSPGGFFGDRDLRRRLAGFRRFVFESPAATIAGTVMNSAKVNFFYDHLLVKEPGTRERTPWHQDQPYWVVDGFQVCTVWLPLDIVPRQFCVEFVAGSRWGRATKGALERQGKPRHETS